MTRIVLSSHGQRVSTLHVTPLVTPRTVDQR